MSVAISPRVKAVRILLVTNGTGRPPSTQSASSMPATIVAPRTSIATVVAYPIREDGLLLDQPRRGALTSFRGDEFNFDLEEPQAVKRAPMVLGVSTLDGVTGYAGVIVAYDRFRADARLVCAIRGGIGEAILAEEGRVPSLDEQRFQFKRPYSDDIYASWEAVGILKKTVLDRVLLCPGCKAVPTFRFACRKCRSGRLEHPLLVHHFACAHVGLLKDFETEVSLKCPKCQTRHLIAGTDFEYAPAEYTCLDCGWKDYELEQTGHCLNCELRFPIHKAVEQELVGYDADRLDALALVPGME